MESLTKQEFEQLQKDHEIGCKTNDYSKMIMSGDSKDLAMKKYIRDNDLCKHGSIEEIQGGQVERCRQCGKEWG
jgi:DNA-directed RNA polymerase subunit RPC12/RpoP